MRIDELRNHPEYHKALDKIKRYNPGFRFTVNFTNIPEAKANALRIVLRDACKLGYLESVSIGHGWDKNNDFTIVEETYKRTGVCEV